MNTFRIQVKDSNGTIQETYKRKNSKGFMEDYPLDQGSRYKRYYFSDGSEDFTHLNSDYITLDKHNNETTVGDKVRFNISRTDLKGTGIIQDIFHSPMKIFVRPNNGVLQNRIIEMDNYELEKMEVQ